MFSVTCPTPTFPNTASFECVNHEGDYVNCSQAVTGTVLKFTCSPGYITTTGTSTLRSCRNGSWGPLNPGCVYSPVSVISPSTTEKPNDSDGIKVICTYATWASYRGINPENFDADMCTHLYYAFAGIWESGDVRVNDDNLDLNQGMNQHCFLVLNNIPIKNLFKFNIYFKTFFYLGMYRNVTEMKRRNPRLKVLLSVGGSKATNNSLWSTLASSAPRIGAFIGSASYFIRTYNFDGLNIDWHYPEEADKVIFKKIYTLVVIYFDIFSGILCEIFGESQGSF